MATSREDLLPQSAISEECGTLFSATRKPGLGKQGCVARWACPRIRYTVHPRQGLACAIQPEPHSLPGVETAACPRPPVPHEFGRGASGRSAPCLSCCTR